MISTPIEQDLLKVPDPPVVVLAFWDDVLLPLSAPRALRLFGFGTGWVYATVAADGALGRPAQLARLRVTAAKWERLAIPVAPRLGGGAVLADATPTTPLQASDELPTLHGSSLAVRMPLGSSRMIVSAAAWRGDSSAWRNASAVVVAVQVVMDDFVTRSVRTVTAPAATTPSGAQMEPGVAFYCSATMPGVSTGVATVCIAEVCAPMRSVCASDCRVLGLCTRCL